MEPRSDITGFLVGWGTHAKNGELIYRDFVCTYSPFFPYLIGLSLALWDSARSIVFLMLVMEAIAIWISFTYYEPKVPCLALVVRLLVYMCLPASLVLCVIGGQEDVWTWLFVALAAFAWYRKSSYLLYGSLLVLGLLSTKATFVLVLPALLLLAKAPFRLAAVLAGWGLLVLGILYTLVGLEFMQPLGEADTLRSPNVLSVLNPWVLNSIGVGEKFWNWIGLLLTVGVGALAAWRSREAEYHGAVSRVFIVTYATMMIAQQSAYSNYIFMFLLPLALYIIDWSNRTQVVLLLLYNLLCVVHPSYWWRLDMPRYLRPSDIWASSASVTDYLMQLGIVLLTGYFIVLSFPKAPTVRR
ncbi:hypothetical protein HNQ92_004965 [Rhabdobacter roseus]|uniref:DUF2029 domain-containing protein n=1 Tax=Rhabdobacter roseus TaxID=1655419 RepID=A0A840TU66_9BACT|nr:hypothetical protein [Rhabdobacter roseus]MBB5286804.1 hypothetical protein [Rhabdobacter roseus]